MARFTLHTDGKGFWSTKATAVSITEMTVDLYEAFDGDPPNGEIRVFFDPTMWDAITDGDIYTDPRFLKEFKEHLATQGYDVSDVDYSEYGMQGGKFVSFDCGEKFITSWKKWLLQRSH